MNKKKQNNISTISLTYAHVVYSADNAFAEILGISILSLFHNLDKNTNQKVFIYILEDNISDCNKEKLNSLTNKYNQPQITFIKSKNIKEEIDSKVHLDRGSESQFSRIFICSLLPKELTEVIYLDCDIIARKSIYELWNVDLNNKTIGAVEDCFSRHYRANLDLEDTDKLFNSGVLLIDLDKWRKNDIEQKLISFMLQKKGRVQMGDQGALNSVLSKDFYPISPKFNAMSIFFDFSYEDMLYYRKPPVAYFCKEIIQETIDNPTLIHFTSSYISYRPWVKNCNHKYVSDWLYYKSLSPWKDTPLREDSRSWHIRFGIALLKVMPKFIRLRITRILQIYVRPLKFRIGL